VNRPERVWKNGSGYQDVYGGGWEIEMLKMIGKSLNLTLDIESYGNEKYRTSPPAIYCGGFREFSSNMEEMTERSRIYLVLHSAWYTPCAVKYQRWKRFFNIFSVDMWICFALSLVSAAITVKCISNYGHIARMHESKSYTNIFGATSNIISVVLSVSVSTQPRSSPLRLFFFCWVCYSFAISTVFQAYLTTFLIEPGYVEPIRTVEQMLASDMKFGFFTNFDILFTDTSDSTGSTILKNAVRCPTYKVCLEWTFNYHNFSTIVNDFTKIFRHAAGMWTDENNRPLACELEYSCVETRGVAFWVSQGSPLLEFINDVLDHIIEGGIFMQIMNMDLYKIELESKYVSPTFDDMYYAINVRHLQAAFYLLLLGYAMAVAFFLTEIMWHRYRSKGRGTTSTSVTDRHT